MDKFGKVCLSFTGKKVAISTTNDSSTYICVANIEDSVHTISESDSSGSALNSPNSSDMSELEDLLEKPIATKVVSIDLLHDVNVNNYIFSAKENTLVVNYSSGGKKQFNVYNAEEGEIIDSDIKNMFNEEKYETEALVFEGDEIKFKVQSKDNAESNESGEYTFNIETKEIKKL